MDPFDSFSASVSATSNSNLAAPHASTSTPVSPQLYEEDLSDTLKRAANLFVSESWEPGSRV